MTVDATKKFDGKAKNYALGRPGYAPELVDCFYSRCGIKKTSVIADIGSGTGKFAKCFLDRGNDVYCVEPNEEMRHQAESELSRYANYHSVAGTAESTTLDNCSIDHITVAQAFHWFNPNDFKSECRRIIRAGGKAFLVWNNRVETDAVNEELYAINAAYCPQFKGFSGGIKKDDDRIADFFEHRYDYVAFDNPLLFDRQTFIARSLSSSYSLKEGDNGYEMYIADLQKLFDKHQKDGVVSVLNQSVAYIGTVR